MVQTGNPASEMMEVRTADTSALLDNDKIFALVPLYQINRCAHACVWTRSTGCGMIMPKITKCY